MRVSTKEKAPLPKGAALTIHNRFVWAFAVTMSRVLHRRSKTGAVRNGQDTCAQRCAKARVSRRAFRQNDRVVCSWHFLDTAYALEGAFDVPLALWTRIQTRIQQFRASVRLTLVAAAAVAA